MPSYNRIILVGHLTRDPELKYTKSDMAFCKCGIAVNHKYKDTEEVCFVDLILWGKQGETFNQYMAKGRAVLVEGRLKLDQWEKDGVKRSKHGVVVDKFTFLGKAGESSPQQAAERPVEAQETFSDDEVPF